MRYLSLLFTLFVCATSVSAQIVTISPDFPNRDAPIVITYDAAQGNGGLVGVADVYMHTGLITSQSTSSSDWKYVVGNWGIDDGKVKMTALGDNKHQITLTIDDYYGIPTSEKIEQLAFVFRNVDGTAEGKTAGGTDILVDFEEEVVGFDAYFETPTEKEVFTSVGSDVYIKVVTNDPTSEIKLFIDGVNVKEEDSSDLLEYTFTVPEVGEYSVNFRAIGQEGINIEAFRIKANPPIVEAPLPDNALPGITRLDDNTIRCVLIAPGKFNAYILGSFNGWTTSDDYFMNITPDGHYLWADIAGVPADEDHALLYLIDGEILTADPFSEMVFDTWNDGGISNTIFPDIPDFAFPKEGYITWLRPDDGYEFQHPKPQINTEDLIIYELLVRDFVKDHSYQEVIDTLDYLSSLGVNAIEFMPVSEFEGNQSWGYNPSFHMALDKYYGTPEKFKELIDACHERGIAVILDVVYNHAFSLSPFAQMWWDPSAFAPTPENPFLNINPTHPFNVGYDFNHESPYTSEFVKRVVKYWIEEYNIDGYRFDLSKGFTQVDAMGDIAAWGNYDPSRVAIWKDYGDHIWSFAPDSKLILEHFGDNDEEQVLTEYGFMVWNNINHIVNEATLGYNDNSNFEQVDYKKKNFVAPLNVSYMESHDEERLMYNNLNFGRQNSSYSVRDLPNALERVAAASSLFYAFPGPKMLWQFGEMGYDYSINTCEGGSINAGCRLSPKPIRWDYLDDLNRKKLVDVTSALMKLRTEHGIATDVEYSYNLNGEAKVYRFEKEDYNGVIVANFGLSSQSKVPIFPTTGIYYDYFTGDSIEVDNKFVSLDLEASEYHIYTSKKLADPIIISGVEDPAHSIADYKLYPNPASDQVIIDLDIDYTGPISISIVDVVGKSVLSSNKTINSGKNNLTVELPSVPDGIYHIILRGHDFSVTDKLFIKK